MKTRVMKQQLRQEIAPKHPYNPMLFDAVYEALDELEWLRDNPMLFDAVYEALDELEWLRAENARIAEELEAVAKGDAA